MTIERALVGTTDAAAVAANYIEDCFSCYLYTGTGAAQTINNGIDLSTKGGLVWAKSRNNSSYHGLSGPNFSTSYFGGYGGLRSDQTRALGSTDFTGVTSTGYTLGYIVGDMNFSGWTYASWTFRKQPKFFDIVTYTGTGSATTIAHSLGCAPGMIIVKRTNTTGNWKVYHSGLTSASYYCDLNATAAQTSDSTVWNSTAPTSSVFSVGTHADVNASGGTYVAYIYAASNSGGFGAAGTDSVVACGSYTGNGSASGPTVTLGWEPQFVLVKMSSSTGDWNIFDNMRGIATGGNDPYLFANTSAAEATTNGDLIDLTATGFQIKGTNAEVNTSSETYIYLAIRRPMKTPTDATKVFMPAATTDGSFISTGFTVDMLIDFCRSGNTYSPATATRLMGDPALVTSSTGAENAGFIPPNGWTSNTQVRPAIFGGVSASIQSFKRAPGFFDVVCYTGTGSAGLVVNHNLGVAPELIIFKSRSSVTNWAVHSSLSSGLILNVTAAANSAFASVASTSSTSITIADPNTYSLAPAASGSTYVAYLFATCPGVSKVFSYTGNGSSQTINCGFAAGARFVLIKRTDAAGDWYVWDTARGIVSANDPHLSLNTTAAEVTTDDTIDPDNSGFIVNQVSATNVNVSSATYIGLAIA